jgi:hypothetical protein
MFGNERRLALTLCYRVTELTLKENRKKIVSEKDVAQIWMMCLHFLDKNNQQLPKKLKGKKLQLLLLLRFLGSHLAGPTRMDRTLQHNLHFYIRPILLDSFEYYGYKNSWVKELGLSNITMKILPKRRYSPAPYIGVGYRDKGSANNSAINGITVNELIKLHHLFEKNEERFYDQDFNSSFHIIDTCSQVDNDIEDVLLDY